MSLRRNFRFALAAAVAALVVLGIATAVTLANYLMWSAQSTRFNSTFESGQLAAELFRFEVAVAERFLPGSTTGQADLDLRYQILLNRLEVIHNSETSAAHAYVPDGVAEYAAIEAAIRRVGPAVAGLEDPQVARAILDELIPMNGRILRLTSTTQNVLTDRIAHNRERIGRVVDGISAVAGALVLLGIVLIGFVLRLKRRSDHVARHDALTGVMNRYGFNAAWVSRPLDAACAIVFLDIDHFKDINDRFGHDVGDVFLVQFTARIADAVQGAELFARLGGDEFVLVFAGNDAAVRAEQCCELIDRLLETPFDVGDVRLTASASMGIASRLAGEQTDPTALMKSADIALYAAKSAGRACHRVFDPAMHELALREHKLRQGLAEAQRREEFHLVFQPIVDLADGRTAGFETLLRWKHPELGAVSPGEFIPVAERSAQIISIGRWVIEQAFREAVHWPDDTFVSINLSARQFTDQALGRFVERALERFLIAPHRVIFEITESVLVHNDAAEIITGFRQLGVQIALDDFGTGFASLSYLRRCEFDKIKIDQSFIRAEPGDLRNAAIVRSICTLAEELDLEVVAEGVETPEQLGFIASVGCRFAQGYLFRRPLPAAECPACCVVRHATRADAPASMAAALAT